MYATTPMNRSQTKEFPVNATSTRPKKFTPGHQPYFYEVIRAIETCGRHIYTSLIQIILKDI